MLTQPVGKNIPTGCQKQPLVAVHCQYSGRLAGNRHVVDAGVRESVATGIFTARMVHVALVLSVMLAECTQQRTSHGYMENAARSAWIFAIHQAERAFLFGIAKKPHNYRNTGCCSSQCHQNAGNNWSSPPTIVFFRSSEPLKPHRHSWAGRLLWVDNINTCKFICIDI